jgi:hypothetical protein
MSARIGADDVGLFESPKPRLLRQITGPAPGAVGLHVLLDPARHDIAARVRGDVNAILQAAGDPPQLASHHR